MRVRYRPQALGDIDEIVRYLQKRNPTAALDVARAIHAAIGLIAEQPYAYQRTRDPDIRVNVLGRYRYVIYYAVLDQDTVEIIHVRHTSRRPWGGER